MSRDRLASSKLSPKLSFSFATLTGRKQRNLDNTILGLGLTAHWPASLSQHHNRKHFLGPYYMSSIVSRILCGIFHLILTTTPDDRYYFYPHFSDKKN
jgi:hypothetical protein